jgi:hypothetical protein
MKYIKIQFTVGLNCIAWQEIDESQMAVVRYLDEQGNELVLPEVTESHVIDPEMKGSIT